MEEHGQSWASRPAPSVWGGEGGSWDNHFLSGQSGCLSVAPAHGSSMPSCYAPVAALGFPSQKGVGGKGRGTEKRQEEEKGRRRKTKSLGGEEQERKDVAWALGARQVTLLFLRSISHCYPTPPRLPRSTQWLLLCWNFTLLDPGPGVLSSHNVQAAEHAAGETHSAS